MANRPAVTLRFFPEGCPDCGTRTVELPRPLVPVPDDFDWSVRDFEGFRRILLEDLAELDPERERWTEADLEVILAEVLAAGLDRASHMLDAVYAERCPQTAVRPQSLVALLTLLDVLDPAWNAVRARLAPPDRLAFGFDDSDPATRQAALRTALEHLPHLMETARAAGLAGIGAVAALVTLEDVAGFLLGCPVVAAAQVRFRTQGAQALYEAVVLLRPQTLRLVDPVSAITPAGRLEDFVAFFERERTRSIPPDVADHPLIAMTVPGPGNPPGPSPLALASVRTALTRLIAPLLPLGTMLRLVDGKRVPLRIALCVGVKPAYFRSEVEVAARAVLSAEDGGFFAPGAYGFGEPLYLSDLEDALMRIEGVEGVVFNSVAIVGRPGSEATATGVLRPRTDEAIALDLAPVAGISLKLTGGLVG